MDLACMDLVFMDLASVTNRIKRKKCAKEISDFMHESPATIT